MRPPARVWTLVAAMLGSALVVSALVLPHLSALDPAWQLPWWVMAPVFWAAEAQVIHFHFRRGAHTFSLNELPLVVGRGWQIQPVDVREVADKLVAVAGAIAASPSPSTTRPAPSNPCRCGARR